MTAPRGVLTLANDATLDWLVAFCESLREREPGLPLAVVPYDGRVAGVRAIAERYRFTLLEDESLAALDALGGRLARQPGRAPSFRRFVAFWGPFETALYADADVLVGAPLAPLFDAFESSGADLLVTDAGMLDQVYVPGPLRDQAAADPAAGFSAGSWMTRRGALDLERVEAIGVEAVAVRDSFVTAGDQPFTNFCVTRAGLEVVRVEEILPAVAPGTWAGHPIAEWDGAVRAADRTWPTYGLPLPLVHWAGFRPDAAMPNRDVWLPYRLRPLSPARRLAYRVLRWWLPGLLTRLRRAAAYQR